MISLNVFKRRFYNHIFGDYTDLIEDSFNHPNFLQPSIIYILVGKDIPVDKGIIPSIGKDHPLRKKMAWIKVSAHLAKLLIQHGGIILFANKSKYWKYYYPISENVTSYQRKHPLLQNILDRKKVINDFIPISGEGSLKDIKKLNLPKKIKDFLKQEYTIYEIPSFSSYMFVGEEW